MRREDETRFYDAERIAAIRNRVLRRMSVLTGADHGRIDESTSFAGDLGLDSLDTAEMVLEWEQELDIHIPDDEADRIRTVADAIEWFERHRGL